MSHPYRSLPDRNFWSRSVSRQFDLGALFDPKSLAQGGSRIVTAGSCFAAELVPYLELHGLDYVRTEYTNPFFQFIPPENMSYAKFSAGYGNIYTARQLVQLLLRIRGRFSPAEDCWEENGACVDPFRPGLRYKATGREEFDALTREHLAATAAAFDACDVFIFTLGLTEAWRSRIDGAVFPAAPGTIAGVFDPERHEFVNFTVGEVMDDLKHLITELRLTNPKVKVVLTVSPVPLVATATQDHVLVASSYSKSVLRVAAGDTARGMENVFYFPSYEIVTRSQPDGSAFEDDLRSVKKEVVDDVMAAFLAPWAASSTNAGQKASWQKTQFPSTSPPESAAARISAAISKAECEEAGADL